MGVDDLPRCSSIRQFVFTCIILILFNSERTASGVRSSEPPRFKIGRQSRSQIDLSCGIGMFQNKHDSMAPCAPTNEGRKSLLFL